MDLSIRYAQLSHFIQTKTSFFTFRKPTDRRCDICLDDRLKFQDEEVVCDGCNAVTHESCYGGKNFAKNSQLDDDDSWLC